MTVKHLTISDWRSNTPQLFSEVLQNNSTSILHRPLQITLKIMGQIAERAVELNDPILLGICTRLTLYTFADPESPDYNKEGLDMILQEEREARANKTQEEILER